MKVFIKLAIIIVSIFSVFLLFAWHFQAHFLLQCPACKWPFPYRAAFCTFLSCLVLYFLYSQHRLKFTKIMGGAIFLLGFQRILEISLPAETGINLALSSLAPPSLHASNMMITAAFGFTMVGVIFVLWTNKKKHPFQEIFILIINVWVLFLGSLGIFTNLFHIRLTEQYHQLIMHLYTAIALVLVGVGILFAYFSRMKQAASTDSQP